MAYAYPDLVAEVRFDWSSASGVKWSNTLHWEFVGTPTPITGTDLGGLLGIISAELAAVTDLCSVQTVLERVTATDMSNVDGGPGPLPADPRTVFPGARVDASVGLSGAVAGDALPTQVALLALNKSDSAQRRFQGRNWWGGLSEADQTGIAKPNQVVVDAWESALTDLCTASNSEWEARVVSYTFTDMRPLVTIDVQPYWRTVKARVQGKS